MPAWCVKTNYKVVVTIKTRRSSIPSCHEIMAGDKNYDGDNHYCLEQKDEISYKAV